MAQARLQERIAVGLVEKTHGIQGVVRVRPLTDYPPRFKQLRTVFVELHSGELLTLDIAKVALRGEQVYLSFKGVETREAALRLKGALIQIEKGELLPLEDDCFYPFEVNGFEVKTTSGDNLGWITDVMNLPANAVLVVKDSRKERLIPVTKEVIREINKDSGVIIIDPIEGLLD